MKLKMIADISHDNLRKNESNYIIKHMTQDGEQLKKVLKEVLPNAMRNIDDPDINGKSPERYIENLFNGKLGDFDKRIVLVCEIDKVIVGILIALPEKGDGNIYRILTLGICKEYRNNGIGKELMLTFNKLLTDRNIKLVSLNVHSNNEKAIRFYKMMNFKNLKE